MEATVGKEKSVMEHSMGTKLAYAIGEAGDMIAYQGFTFLVFTFYFAVIKIDVRIISLGFIIWSVWNAINDPLQGYISDRSNLKILGGGKRRSWIILGIIPLAIIMPLLFTSPAGGGRSSFIYFLIIIILFDTFYTMCSLNRVSVYPEMFLSDEERAQVGMMRRTIMVLGLIIAFVLPTLVFIKDMANIHSLPGTMREYQYSGLTFGILVLLLTGVTIIWGIKEKKEFTLDAGKAPNFISAYSTTLKNKSFLTFVVASMMNWYVFGILPMIVPVYGTYVLGIGPDFVLRLTIRFLNFDWTPIIPSSILLSVLLLVAFLFSILGVVIWKAVGEKVGVKRGFAISIGYWIITLLPLLFIRQYYIALIDMVFIGIGLGAGPYFIDRCVSDIVDEDELKTGVRREGVYYGANAFIIRLSTILVVLSISLVLETTGWRVYDPKEVSPQIIRGLQMLMSVFPAGALIIGFIFMLMYPLNVDRIKEIQKERERLHQEKKDLLE